MALWGNNDNIVSSGTVTLNYASRVVTGAGTSFGANAAVAAGLSPAGFSTVFIVAPTGTAVGDTIIVDRWPVGSGSTITGIGATSVSFASTITKAVAAGQNVLFFGASGAGIANTDFGKIGDVIRFGVRGGAGSGQYFGEGIIVSIANTQSCTIGSTQGLSGDAISATQHLLSELPKQTAKDSTFIGRQDASFATIGQAIDVDAASAVGADALSAEIFTFPQGGFAISAGDQYLDSPNGNGGAGIAVIGVGTANGTVTSLSPVGFSTIFVVAPPGVVAGDSINVTIDGVAGQTIASVAATSITLAANGGISTISVAVAKDSRIQFSNDNLVSLASTISNAVSITDKLYFQRKSGGYDRIVYGISATTSALYDGDAGNYRTEGSGWVGVQTYMDMHGNLRVKSEILVATSGIQTGIHGIGYPTAENG